MARFTLSENFLDKYKDVKPKFGFGGLGEFVYRRTYSRIKENGEKEEWWETVKRVVEGTYNMQKQHVDFYNLGWNPWKAQSSAQEMYDRMFTFKFLPPGRGLWAMGTAITEERGLFAALNNCLAGETRIITKQGVKEIQAVVDTTQTLLTKNGKWIDAPIRSFGVQELRKVVLKRQGVEKVIYATPDHRWFSKSKNDVRQNRGYSENTTDQLDTGHRLQYIFGQGVSSLNISPQGIQRGFVFGDGTTEVNGCIAYVCGEKDKDMLKYFPNNHITEGRDSVIRLTGMPFYHKQLPDINESPAYLYGWLAGYFAADGSCDKNGQVRLSSQSKEALEFVVDLCAKLGIGTYNINSERRLCDLTNSYRTVYSITFMRDTLSEEFFLLDKHKKNFVSDTRKTHWVVQSVEETDRVEEVYCATVPEYGAFAIEGNILTGNCGFYSTKDMDKEPKKPFLFLFDMSMVGAGIGFDTDGAGKLTITQPDVKKKFTYTIPDSREGWVESLSHLLEGYFNGGPAVDFEYHEIREAGEPIKGFGGVSSGYKPLEELHEFVRELLDENIGNKITGRIITDIMNKIGTCVVAGNIRRSSEIVFGDPYDEDFLNLKNYEVNPERAAYGWASNNSVYAEIGMDYADIAERIVDNGEPGLMWLDQAREYGRMGDAPNNKDHRAKGGNPCLEQTLESGEMCCLVETFPYHHDSLEDYKKTLKYAYLYAKTVTLGQIHWVETNRIQMRNRRIGCSPSGVAQFVTKVGIGEAIDWFNSGYDEIQRLDKTYSDWLAIPRSIKTTSVKPSGTVSLLAGSTPGVHFPSYRHYIRRVRLAKNSDLVPALEKAGYKIEPCVGQERDTVVVEFPVSLGDGIKTTEDVTMWEQLHMAAMLQEHWADNQVSCTVTFDREEEGDHISSALDFFQYKLKGVSFLPRDNNVYPQMPYEKITKEEYDSMMENITAIDFSEDKQDSIPEKFCDGETCLVE